MDVLCIGHAAWDISVFLDGYPVENSKLEIHEMLECGGGPAANAAYLLSRWGVACGLATAIGDDSYARRIEDEFAAVGTDITMLAHGPQFTTPVSVIVVNRQNGSRTIINRKAADGVPLTISPEKLQEASPRVLHFDGHELPASLDAMARFPRAKTVLDAGSAREGSRELARRVDFLVASERFACQMSGQTNLQSPNAQAKAVAALHAWNGRPIVITLGERGMLFGTPDHFGHYPAFVVKAIDTTAAGDIFHGAFVYGVLNDWPIARTLRFASATAAISATQRGGRTSIPALTQVEEFLQNNKE